MLPIMTYVMLMLRARTLLTNLGVCIVQSALLHTRTRRNIHSKLARMTASASNTLTERLGHEAAYRPAARSNTIFFTLSLSGNEDV